MEIKQAISFIIASKEIKYLGINLIKEMKNLYIENYKRLLKEIKDINKWKYTLISCIRRQYYEENAF